MYVLYQSKTMKMFDLFTGIQERTQQLQGAGLGSYILQKYHK